MTTTRTVIGVDGLNSDAHAAATGDDDDHDGDSDDDDDDHHHSVDATTEEAFPV